MTVRVLLFDIDGTLIHAGGAGRTALIDALESAFGTPSPNCDISFSGRTDGDLLREVLRINRLPDDEPTRERLVDHYLRHLPHRLHDCAGTVLPGIPQLLDDLANRADVHVGCMTGNLAHSARLKLEHYGLWSLYFSVGMLFSGDRFEHRDDLARAAARQLKQHFANAEHDIWVIGDTPRDIQCARVMGARVLGCCTGDHSRQEMEACQPDALVDDFHDAEAIAELLTR